MSDVLEIACTQIEDHGRPWVMLPWCEGEVAEATRRWRTRTGQSDVCSFRARYLVNGDKLCERHAGRRLIDLHLGAE